jgi:hypothetical protein
MRFQPQILPVALAISLTPRFCCAVWRHGRADQAACLSRARELPRHDGEQLRTHDSARWSCHALYMILYGGTCDPGERAHCAYSLFNNLRV